jgi:hypothetical protein
MHAKLEPGARFSRSDLSLGEYLRHSVRGRPKISSLEDVDSFGMPGAGGQMATWSECRYRWLRLLDLNLSSGSPCRSVARCAAKRADQWFASNSTHELSSLCEASTSHFRGRSCSHTMSFESLSCQIPDRSGGATGASLAHFSICFGVGMRQLAGGRSCGR